MARIRTIKPDLPLDEELALLPFMHRYIFALLPMLADKEGRFEDRPHKIKAQLLPYDAVLMNDPLQALHNSGFITRYEADGKNYIQINNFVKHQRPHHTEKDSEIPAPKKLTKKGQNVENIVVDEEPPREPVMETGVKGRKRADEDKDQDMQNFRLVADKVQSKYPKFNPYAFVNKKSMNGRWPIKCFTTTFENMLRAEHSDTPTALAEHLWKIYSKNVMEQIQNETDAEPVDMPDELKEFLGKLGRSM